MSTEGMKVSLPTDKHNMDAKTTAKTTSKRKRDSITGELEAGRKAPRRNSSHAADVQSHSPPPGRQPQDQPGFFTLDTPDSSQREITAAQLMQVEAILSDEHAAPEPGSFRAVNQNIDEEAVDNQVEESRLPPPPPGRNISQEDFLRPHPIGGNGSREKKDPVGSQEWHQRRKNSHKEVERKRRETINDGINAISKLLPLPQRNEKNKGQILTNAAEYIISLVEDQSNMLDKWTSEKLIVDEAVRNLGERNEHLLRVVEAWKECARNAGVNVEEYDTGVPPFQPSGGLVQDVGRRQSEARIRESVPGVADPGRSSAYGTHDASAVTMEGITQVQED